MEDGARIERMIEILLADHPEHSFLVRQCGKGYGERRSLIRGLMALRPPGPLSEEFYRLEGALLDEEREASGLIDVLSLPASALPKITHFHGDMLRLVAGAYVNEASVELQGCFVPGHRSLDSRIHSAAGLELRNACKALFDKDKPIEPGYAGMTKGYHLAAPYVIHAVGPSIRGRVRDIDLNALRKTYRKRPAASPWTSSWRKLPPGRTPRSSASSPRRTRTGRFTRKGSGSSDVLLEEREEGPSFAP